MITEEVFREVIAESRLWEEGEANHRFLLSPDVFKLNKVDAQKLQDLAESLHECLGGLGRLVAIAATPGLSHGRVWNQINRIGGHEIPSIYRKLLTYKPGSVPAICKVDLMIDSNSNFKIAEIDGHNKHGMGYSTLAGRLRSVAYPTRKTFPGVAKTLASWIEQRGGRAVLIYSNKERFYKPEVLVLADELANYGVELVVANETEVVVENDSVQVAGKGTFTNFVDLPFLDHSISRELPEIMARGYLEGRFNFVIPPKPFLGSKAVLALLSNPERNPEIEAVLCSQISQMALTTVRNHLPSTYLLTKGGWMPEILELGSSFVLKEVVTSGMKGTLFSDDPRFPVVLRQAQKSNGLFVLQEEVENHQFEFDYWNENGELKGGRWFTRVTVHFATRSVADVVVTARQDKAVHGAPDCLQLGTILV